MYALDLICVNGHEFEGWFGSRAAFEAQHQNASISCPACSVSKVDQVISAVRIRKHTESDEPKKSRPRRSGIASFIEKHFEDVGNTFADEALKIHTGESRHRSIRGTATPDEEQMLSEEGVDFVKLPEFQ